MPCIPGAAPPQCGCHWWRSTHVCLCLPRDECATLGLERKRHWNGREQKPNMKFYVDRRINWSELSCFAFADPPVAKALLVAKPDAVFAYDPEEGNMSPWQQKSGLCQRLRALGMFVHFSNSWMLPLQASKRTLRCDTFYCHRTLASLVRFKFGVLRMWCILVDNPPTRLGLHKVARATNIPGHAKNGGFWTGCNQTFGNGVGRFQR